MERNSGTSKGFWKKYRKWMLLALGIYIIAIVVLILLTRGPQSEPFLYQVF